MSVSSATIAKVDAYEKVFTMRFLLFLFVI